MIRNQRCFPYSIVGFLGVICLTASMAVSQDQGNREEPGVGQNPRVSTGAIAPKLEGLGDHHHPVATDSSEAQAFFDQGLALAYAFNHAEAERAFQETARLDPNCAMAYWGQALVLGPNINQPMQADAIPKAYEAIQQAVALKDDVSQKERDYIDALATRYSDDPGADRGALDQAYAEAMADLSEKYPSDPDAKTLYASALMNLMPWSYWTKDGNPKPHTPEVLAALESVMAQDPDHAGAHHYYIHAMEEHHPDRAENSADRLTTLMPGAGHIVHMPSHIYMRLGRYRDAYDANERAIAADEGYITQCRSQGIYPLAYYPHNVHFLAWGAQQLGRSQEAIAAARKVSKKAKEAMAGEGFGLHESFVAMPLYMLARFGKWDAILEEPKPNEDWPYVTGIWHYARGLAFNFKGKPQNASEELNKVREILDSEALEGETVGFAQARRLLTIAAEILTGEIEAQAGNHDKAIAHVERAARLEDSLAYNEPPDWYYPVRHTLGALLLEAGRPVEAEAVYWNDLEQNPHNGWSLYGLAQALNDQGNDSAADAIKARFQKAWVEADVELSSSRF